MNFWGIHGISIINSILLSLWQKYLALNAESFANGQNLQYITAYPFVFNPYFLIPFIITPILNGIISYYAFYFGLVNKVYIEVPWMFPFFVGSLLSTNDFKALLLSLINVFISILIYYP